MSWETVALGEVLAQRIEEVPIDRTTDYPLAGVRAYGKGLFASQVVRGSETSYDTFYRFRAGDLVLSRVKGWEGAIGVVPPELDRFYGSKEFPAFTPRHGRVDTRFLAYWFRSAEGARALKGAAMGLGARRERVKETQFLAIRVRLPSLLEQKRILGRLDGLMDKLAEISRIADQRAKLVDRTWQAELRGRLNGLAVHTVPLSDLLLAPPRNGWSPPSTGAGEGTPVLALSSVTGFRYRADQHKLTQHPTSPLAHYWLQAGDLLVTRSNTPELVGHAAIYDGFPSPCIFPDLMMVLRLREGRVLPEFVHLWLQSPLVRDHLTRRAKGTSPTMKKINQAAVETIPFPADLSVEEQRALCVRFAALRRRLDAFEVVGESEALSHETLRSRVLLHAFSNRL